MRLNVINRLHVGIGVASNRGKIALGDRDNRGAIMKTLFIFMLLSVIGCGDERDSEEDKPSENQRFLIGEWINSYTNWSGELIIFRDDKTCGNAIVEFTGYVLRTEMTRGTYESTDNSVSFLWEESSNPYNSKSVDITYSADASALMIATKSDTFHYERDEEEEIPKEEMTVVYGYFVLGDFIEHEIGEL